MAGISQAWAFRQGTCKADVSQENKKQTAKSAVWRTAQTIMQKLGVRKKNGKVRVCYNPDPELKRRLRALVPQLNLLAEELDVHHVQHGFTEGRSPVTNAKPHIGWEYTVSFDLADFFDTVTPEHVDRACPNGFEFAPGSVSFMSCFVDGAARQGLPTSPALANIAASPLDKDIMALCPRGRFADPVYIYTRYADDLTFSCHTMATVNLLLQEIPKLVEKHQFKINASKTKVQAAAAGRRIITGVAVGEKDITITREVRRRIRAGHHQDDNGLRKRNIRRMLFHKNRWKRRIPLRARFYSQLRGLKEWARLKAPANEPEHQNKAVAIAQKVVTAVCGKNISNRIFGSFTRRIG